MTDAAASSSSVALMDRKLTQDEARELKILLVPYFHASGGDSDVSPEDINDFLDYVIAMVNNQKDVDYIIKELVGMEMEFCNATVAEKVGRELTGFLEKLVKGEDWSGNNKSSSNSKSEKGGKIASLKVRRVQ